MLVVARLDPRVLARDAGVVEHPVTSGVAAEHDLTSPQATRGARPPASQLDESRGHDGYGAGALSAPAGATGTSISATVCGEMVPASGPSTRARLPSG